MIEVILDALFDSLKAFIFIFIIYILISFIEFRVARKLSKENHLSSLYGSLLGLIPQCGVSVVASDLYLKRHISVGTLIAIFLSCSDEAIPLLISSGNTKAFMALPLLIAKFVIGFISGFLIDLVINHKVVEKHLDECDHHDIEIHTGCCNHHIDDSHEDGFEKHLWHPFLHSLKLFGYILAINIIFGMLVYFIGEDKLLSFLEFNKYIAPLFATLIGLIPNCASSVILISLYLENGISFGTTLAGLLVNAGLGLVFLFKSKNGLKRNISILATLMSISLVMGYLTCLIIGF